jgi:hypothetical protein
MSTQKIDYEERQRLIPVFVGQVATYSTATAKFCDFLFKMVEHDPQRVPLAQLAWRSDLQGLDWLPSSLTPSPFASHPKMVLKYAGLPEVREFLADHRTPYFDHDVMVAIWRKYFVPRLYALMTSWQLPGAASSDPFLQHCFQCLAKEDANPLYSNSTCGHLFPDVESQLAYGKKHVSLFKKEVDKEWVYGVDVVIRDIIEDYRISGDDQPWTSAQPNTMPIFASLIFSLREMIIGDLAEIVRDKFATVL